VSRGVLLSTMAVGLAAPTEARGQKTGAQVLDVGQTGDELIPFISECLQGNGHRSLLSDRHYKLSGIINCQIRKENPNQTLSDSAGDFYVVRPLGPCVLPGGSNLADNEGLGGVHGQRSV
jgi:hypothetical protein